MKQVQVHCDRCGKIVNGIIDDVPSAGFPSRMTSGFYDVSRGCWARFARQGERNVCDGCMSLDPEYQELYTTE